VGDKDRVSTRTAARPLLLVDIDGVISLFATPQDGAGDDGGRPPREGSFHSIEGIPHFLSATAAAHLLELASEFDLVWASGWEERADEHLPHLLGLPAGLPHLSFDRDVGGRPSAGSGAHRGGHWKLAAIDAYAAGRPLAWIDDAVDGACRTWARERSSPTLLVQTDPVRGLTGEEAELLLRWAAELRAGA
jgi:hypothetical protein